MRRKNSREYRIWKGMKSRCYAPSQASIGYYQADGIQVCDRWKNDFDAFLADMGSCPYEDASIERIDYTKDYCPENCKWIHRNEQQKNRRNVPIYEYQGKRQCLKDWSRELGMDYELIRGRLRRGVPFEDAIKPDLYERIVTINGKEQTVTEWCEELGLNAGNVFSRINRGWSKTDALLKDQEKIKRRN